MMNGKQVAFLLKTTGLSYLFATLVLLVVLAFISPGVWFRVLRLLGIGSSVLGATISLVPRALRGTEEIQAQADTYYGSNPHVKKALLRDTKIAQWGMALILVGFLLQLFGNLG
jgi:hypothetical protein